jgi:hypothetical protein
MKKVLLSVVLLLVFSLPAFATSLTGDVNTNTNTNTLVGTNTNVNTNANTNLNTNANLNTNLNTQGQMQGQGQVQTQGQEQKQSQTAVGKVKTTVSNNTTIENPRELMQTPIVPTVSVPMIQGKIFDYTSTIPNFDGIQKLGNTEVIKSVIAHKYIFNVSCFLAYSQIYLEDVESVVLSLYTNSTNKTKFRYKVIGKDASDSSGAMLGGASGIVGNDGLTSGTGAGGLGIARSGANPSFIVYEYQVK